MGPWTLITVLVAMQVSAAWTEDCNDRCFCPVGKTMTDCNSRGLTQIPPGYWPEITLLNLPNNKISNISKWSLTGFPNVEVMYLNKNLLTELDLDAFSTLPVLSTLYLHDNAITTITAPVPGVTIGSLQVLYLNSNRISNLDPNALTATTDLQALSLRYNPVVVQPGQPILNHPTLALLQLLSGMTAVWMDLGPETFAGLPSLRQVDLYAMGITSIEGAFNNTLLSVIELSLNLITEVTAGTFSSGNAIQRLSLSYNPLERLDVAAVENALAPGAYLEFDETPIACNCDYEELYWWAKEQGVKLNTSCRNKITCSFTRHLEKQ